MSSVVVDGMLDDTVWKPRIGESLIDEDEVAAGLPSLPS